MKSQTFSRLGLRQFLVPFSNQPQRLLQLLLMGLLVLFDHLLPPAQIRLNAFGPFDNRMMLVGVCFVLFGLDQFLGLLE